MESFLDTIIHKTLLWILLVLPLIYRLLPDPSSVSSITPIIAHGTIASRLTYSLIRRLLPIHFYFDCFLILQSFNSFIA